MMQKYDRIFLGKLAKELGVVRDTLEKVFRLLDILSFIERDSLLKDSLALKGGTAINLTILDLPRLSVDIDMDYAKNSSRDEMLAEREKITEHIQKYMFASGYTLHPRSKSSHALDSFVFEYLNAGGTKDNLKIEINYILRCHVFPISHRTVNLPWKSKKITVFSVDPIEIFSAKTVALLNRAAARDLYDIFNLKASGLLNEFPKTTFRKCIIFYYAIASEDIQQNIALDKIKEITAMKLKTDLLPVLRHAEHFDLSKAQEDVKEYLKDILLSKDHLPFLQEFSKGRYCPELLFDDIHILERIKKHPMALWKCKVKDINKPTK